MSYTSCIRGHRQDPQQLSVAKRTPSHRAKQRYITIDTKYLGNIHGMPIGDALSQTTRNYALIKAKRIKMPKRRVNWASLKI